jgi:hypothetical protein
VLVDERAAVSGQVAMECGDEQASVQVPHLQRLIRRGRNCPLPVRCNRRAKTEREWPSRVRSIRPVSAFHTISLRSSDAETARFPSGVTATPWTGLEWPSRVRKTRLALTSHTFSIREEAEIAE